jgi:hypothetical protein
VAELLSSAASTMDSLFARAAEQRSADDVRSAIASLNEALAIDSRHAGVRFALGKLQGMLAQWVRPKRPQVICDVRGWRTWAATVECAYDACWHTGGVGGALPCLRGGDTAAHPAATCAHRSVRCVRQARRRASCDPGAAGGRHASAIGRQSQGMFIVRVPSGFACRRLLCVEPVSPRRFC